MELVKKGFSVFLILLFAVFAFCACEDVPSKKDEVSFVGELGVWWWNDSLGEEYLSFAKENGVTEIYYDSDFDLDTEAFIKSANEKGINVYWLAGDYRWFEDRKSNLISQIEAYQAFQSQVQCKFSGIHLDIEPHQSPNFETNREETILNYLELVEFITSTYPNITFDFDIPFWLEDELTFRGETKEAFKFVFDMASRVFVMSYRDTAEEILAVATEELEYAKERNKPIFLCVETGEEDPNITFFEEGKEFLGGELEKIKNSKDVGISIHDIVRWKNLKD